MTEQECKKNKYEYIGETCYRPRYNYLNNAPYKGNVPSVVKGLFNIEPINLWSVYNGTPLRGLEIEECPPYIKKDKNVPDTKDTKDTSSKKKLFSRNNKEYFGSVNETTHIFNVMIIIAFLLCIIGVIVFLIMNIY
jgi:hypothetical protein